MYHWNKIENPEIDQVYLYIYIDIDIYIDENLLYDIVGVSIP